MRLYRTLLVFFSASAIFSCATKEVPQTPLDTLKTYTQAIKKKDVVKMKALLSRGSIKMAEDEAKAQNVSIDEIILGETLFSANQKTLKFRDEKIDGETALIEVENSFGSFDRIPFAKENGLWKIAKDKFAEEFQKQIEEEQKKVFDEPTIQSPSPE